MHSKWQQFPVFPPNFNDIQAYIYKYIIYLSTFQKCERNFPVIKYLTAIFTLRKPIICSEITNCTQSAHATRKILLEKPIKYEKSNFYALSKYIFWYTITHKQKIICNHCNTPHAQPPCAQLWLNFSPSSLSAQHHTHHKLTPY